MTPAGWAIIVGAIFLGLGQLLTIYLTHLQIAANTKLTTDGVAAIVKKADIITGHVNGAAHATAARIKVLEDKLEHAVTELARVRAGEQQP